MFKQDLQYLHPLSYTENLNVDTNNDLNQQYLNNNDQALKKLLKEWKLEVLYQTCIGNMNLLENIIPIIN